jgi:hypothetical protein
MTHHATIWICLAAATLLATSAIAKTAGDTPKAQRATHALNILAAQGFAADLQEKSRSAFANFHQQGKDFAATVAKRGVPTFVVMVDPDTGESEAPGLMNDLAQWMRMPEAIQSLEYRHAPIRRA